MIENDQIILLPVKIFEVILYLFVLISLNKKYKEISFSQRPPIHKFFVYGILGWIWYMIFDSIIYIIAPLSIPEGTIFPLVQIGGEFLPIIQGYNIEYPSLFIANILRDLAMPGGIIMAWFYCAASVKILNGVNLHEQVFGSEEKIIDMGKVSLKWGTLWKICAIIIIILLVALDGIIVKEKNSGDVDIVSNWAYGTFLILIFFTFATILMVKQMINLRKTEMDDEFKNRAKNLGRSIITFTIGLYYWGLLGSIAKLLPDQTLEIANIIFLIIGHVIWILSAIYVYLAFQTKNAVKME